MVNESESDTPENAHREELSGPEAPALNVHVVGPTSGERSPTRLLVLLHGYGADEFDLAPLAEYIDPAGDFFAICPRGPFDAAPFGAGWYARGVDRAIDPEVFARSVEAVEVTVDWACREFGFDRGDAALIGFSQGGAMALASALGPTGGWAKPAAVACLSGVLAEVEDYRYDFSDPPRLLVQLGTEDPIVTPERGRHTHEVLTREGVEHTFEEYPMAHEITPQSIAGLRSWLTD